MSVESLSKALSTPGLDPRAKLILIGIANHDGDGGAWPSVATLARYADCSARTVQRHLRNLEKAELVKIHVKKGGNTRTPEHERPNLYELRLSPPPVTRDVTTPPDTAVTPEPSSEPSVEPPSSSLRSDEHSDGQESGYERQEADPVNDICARYWEMYSELRGVAPTAAWVTLRAVVKKVLKSVDDHDEIVAAMVNTKVMTGEGVMEEIVRRRSRAGEQVTTSPINPLAIRLHRAWSQWRGLGGENLKPELCQALTTFMNWDVTPGEVAARLGGYARANGKSTPTLDDLRAVPLPPWQGDANWTVEDIFTRYATAERRLSR